MARQTLRIWSIALLVGLWLARCGVCLAEDERAGKPDSYLYYGPQGLWKTWNLEQRLGRDTWIFWTWGNQNFLRDGALIGGNAPLPVSLDFFRALDSRQRDTRFKRLGLINEPNFVKADKPDRYGFWLDVWKGDPYYPNTESYPLKKHPVTNEPIDSRHYGLASTKDGRGTGIVGLRLFDNPKFDEAKWDPKKYFANPGKTEPPYLVGFSCAFCHMSFDPTNPPPNPEAPRWEHLASNLGNQYFREGEMFLANGRILFGDRNPGPNFSQDPYDTEGLGPTDFLYQYAVTQQPGTSETSRISYDFINNPNTINGIARLGVRPDFEEVTPFGKKAKVKHILKDGADSVGIEWALMRVPINIGCEGRYWGEHLFNPGSGRKQHPVRWEEMLYSLPAAQRQELETKYGIPFSQVSQERALELKRDKVGLDWAEAWRRVPALASFLSSYDGYRLADAPEGPSHITRDAAVLKRGREVYAAQCAACHSSQQPPANLTAQQRLDFYVDQLSGDNLKKNFLSDDRRYSVRELGTNMARALATNAIEGDVWAEFSSKDYKALDPVGTFSITQRPFLDADAVTTRFTAPGGGRGYYRTPTLVNIWATAPFFHNNGLGKYTGRVDVAGRVEEFEDACEKLLWPEKREMHIKRTLAPCTLIPDLQAKLPQIVAFKLTHLVAARLESKLPKTAVQKLRDEFKPVVEEALRTSFKTLATFQAAEVERIVNTVAKDKVGTLLAGLELPESVKQPLQQQVLTVLQQEVEGLKRAMQLDVLTIPEGTPINLYANLHVASMPYAVLAHVNYGHDKHELAKALLDLSDCPDLVEDKGHLFGQNLQDADKRALIEFLKTL